MGARILLVEDNGANLELMQYLLRAFGHDVTGVENGIAGIESAKAGRYELVLTDILMPGIDGYELAKRFREDPALAALPLVAVSALAMVGDREKILASGFDGYIAKPIDPETFAAQVESFLKPASAAASDSTPLILVVDDVQVNIDVIASSLRPRGYRVIEAHDAREAFERASATHPAMILCDLHMAGGNGFELLKAIRSAPDLHATPVYFISSTAGNSNEKLQAYQLGVDRFLERPIDPADLCREVELALARSGRADDSHR